MSELPVNKFKLAILSLILLIPLEGCKEPPETGKNEKIKVSVSILPYKDFVKAVGGDLVEVNVVIPPGADPHSFENTPRQLTAVNESELYFRVGDIFTLENEILNESGIDKSIIVDCSENLKLINNNPHVWLDPDNAEKIIRIIYKIMNSKFPALQNTWRENTEIYLHRLNSVDEEIKSMFSSLNNKIMMVYHPAWTYFADHYGLVEKSIESDGKLPNAGDLKNLIDFARSRNVTALFIDPRNDPAPAETIAKEIGAQLIEIDPLPAEYISNLKSTADKIKKYLR